MTQIRSDIPAENISSQEGRGRFWRRTHPGREEAVWLIKLVTLSSLWEGEPRTESTRGSVRSGKNSPSSHMVPKLLSRNILHLLWKLLRWGIISHLNIDIIILCWQCYFTMLLTQMPIFPTLAKDSFFSDLPTLLVKQFSFLLMIS